jgi:hypothetical protein
VDVEATRNLSSQQDNYAREKQMKTAYEARRWERLERMRKALYSFDMPVLAPMAGVLTAWYRSQVDSKTRFLRDLKELNQVAAQLASQELTYWHWESPHRYELLADPNVLKQKSRQGQRELEQQIANDARKAEKKAEKAKEILEAFWASKKSAEAAQAQLIEQATTHSIPPFLLEGALNPNHPDYRDYLQDSKMELSLQQKSYASKQQQLREYHKLTPLKARYAELYDKLNANREGAQRLFNTLPQYREDAVSTHFERWAQELKLSAHSIARDGQWQPMVALNRFFGKVHGYFESKTPLFPAQKALFNQFIAGFAQEYERSQKIAVGLGFATALTTLAIVTWERRLHLYTQPEVQ